MTKPEDFKEIEVNEQEESSFLERNIPNFFSKQKQPWEEKSIIEKVSAHKSLYARTGIINFPSLEVVARMAAEGPVFLPCEAEKKCADINELTKGINHSSRQLLSELERESSQPVTVNQQLLTLNQFIQRLLSEINHLLPYLDQFVSTEKREQYLSNRSELQYASAYLIQHLNSDLERNQPLKRSKEYLRSLPSKAVILEKLTRQIIDERTPLNKGS